MAMHHVTSPDGTTIAYERAGNGPPVVLVHGSLNDRTAWRAVIPALAERYTVYAMDRRGRGESGPPAEHALERQFEDVVSVIEAAGERVNLVGHSYGAHCALGAAALAPERVRRLALYEPPTPHRERGEMGERFESGDPDEALAYFMEHGIGMPADQIGALRASPFWSYLRSFVSTMSSEGRALMGHGFDPSRYASLTMPVLFLAGSQTVERLGEVMRMLEPHLPQAEWVIFEGHGHAAQLTAPNEFAEALLAFFLTLSIPTLTRNPSC
jgi:pimeloyl-ACP methyl ester carboxylesterase